MKIVTDCAADMSEQELKELGITAGSAVYPISRR